MSDDRTPEPENTAPLPAAGRGDADTHRQLIRRRLAAGFYDRWDVRREVARRILAEAGNARPGGKPPAA